MILLENRNLYWFVYLNVSLLMFTISVFGLSFLWFKIKWSPEKGLWYQLQVPDKATLLRAVIAEQTRTTVDKCKFDKKVLARCGHGNIYKGQTLQGNGMKTS